MSRYPIRFPKDTDFWKTNHNCSICKIIDESYANIFNNDEDILSQKNQAALKSLDENYLVNGYQLLLVYEKNYDNSILQNIKNLKSYKSNNKAFMNEVYRQYQPEDFDSNISGNPYTPTLLHGRWCQNCGARKPSIYDTEREIKDDKSNTTFI